MRHTSLVNIEKLKRFSEFSEDFYFKKLLRGSVLVSIGSLVKSTL